MTDSPTKPIFKSKTFWLNILFPIIMVVATTVGSSDRQVPEDFDGRVLMWIGMLQSILNIIVRFATKQAVTVVVLLFCLMFSQTANADIVLVVRQDGHSYTFDTNTRQVVTEVRHDTTIIEKGIVTPTPSNPPTNPGTPTPSPGTPTDPVAESAYNIAASLGDKNDAATMATTYRLVAEQIDNGTFTKQDALEHFAALRRLASADLKSNWTNSWKSLDEEMSKATDLSKWLKSTADGFARYAGTTAASLLVENSEQPEEINVSGIVKLIEMILQFIQLLKNAGII